MRNNYKNMEARMLTIRTMGMVFNAVPEFAFLVRSMYESPLHPPGVMVSRLFIDESVVSQFSPVK